MMMIPMFPLSILPLPGEMVPLHIFEPRYRQLLQEAESDDISFGIFFNSTINEEKIGSLMKLESVIKRYPQGESDVIVKCHDIFSMEKMYRTFKSKLYPAGDVSLWEIDLNAAAEIRLVEQFMLYLSKRNISQQQSSYSVFAIAQEINLEVGDRYSFLLSDDKTRAAFLLQRIKYLMEILDREVKSKDVFHLN